MARAGMASGIGREVAGDILDKLASRVEARCNEDGRQVRTASAERNHSVARAASEKTRNDDNLVRRELRQDP